jgi:hypothetical protein
VALCLSSSATVFRSVPPSQKGKLRPRDTSNVSEPGNGRDIIGVQTSGPVEELQH